MNSVARSFVFGRNALRRTFGILIAFIDNYNRVYFKFFTADKELVRQKQIRLRTACRNNYEQSVNICGCGANKLVFFSEAGS